MRPAQSMYFRTETGEPYSLWEEQLQGRNSITVYDANQVLDNSRRDVTGMMNCQSNCSDSHRTEPGKSEVGDQARINELQEEWSLGPTFTTHQPM